MTNRQIAGILEQIADILQIKGDHYYKIQAYRNAAASICSQDEEIEDLYYRGHLDRIPGVGKTIRTIIEELIVRGSSSYQRELFAEIPPGLLEMLRLPGIAHKTVKTIYQYTGIDNLEGLQQAAQKKELRQIPGLGSKIEHNILQGVKLLKQREGKFPLGIALPAAEALLRYLLGLPGIIKADITGSLRRGKALVGDIDIIAAAVNNNEAISQIKQYRFIERILQEEDNRIAGVLDIHVHFEVILVEVKDYYPALFRTTGSKEHVNLLCAEGDFLPLQNIKSEEAVYDYLGLPYIAPELRENRGEIEAARQGSLPRLVREADLKGDLHMHSDWSDGADSILDMAGAAMAMNYDYIAITEHSVSRSISRGLDEKRLYRQLKLIDEINSGLDGFRIFKGIEVDIRRDGSLDLDTSVLQHLDLVIASIHSHFNLDRQQQSQRILRAMDNEQVNMIGHLSGRLINKREAYPLDIDRILRAAADSNTILEINSYPDRLDLDDLTARKAKELGIKMAINSDAHEKDDLNLIRYGIMTARRGWLEPGDVINCWPAERLIQYLRTRPARDKKYCQE